MSKPIIAYYRCSTEQQRGSGLGLEAQRTAVEQFARAGDYTVVAEFTEVESGKCNTRSVLQNALVACKKQKAKLVIARLDRLSRNLAFIATLMDSKISFICCDNPHATKFTIQILGAVAEHEREMIAKRTREGLAEAKKRGVVLGNPALGAASRAAAADRDAGLRPILEQMREMSYRDVARELTDRYISAPRGGVWNPMSAMRAMKRLGIAGERAERLTTP